MLIKTDDLRKFRPIAQNIDDAERLQPYVNEAESLRIIDVLGASLYRWLDTTDFSKGESFDYITPSGKVVTISIEQYNEIMNGGYYGNPGCDCVGGYSAGLIAAISYIAYSRFIVNNPINVTAYGVKVKNTEFSENVNDSILIRSANDARKIGEAYLEKCVEQMKVFGLIECRKYSEGAGGKYHVFGKKGI